MSWTMRILLIVGSVWMSYYVLRKIRKNKMHTEDSVFWLFFSAILIIIGLFPGIAVFLSDVIGVLSPANLVFLSVIFVLIFKLFLVDQKVSQLQYKMTQMAQKYAIEKEEIIK